MMRLPTPQQLGLPDKFERWRPVQESALEFLFRSTKRVKAPCLPTGSGKTAVYVGYTLATGQPTCFVTQDRGLQDQILAEFQDVGMVDIRGRRNYPCGLKDDYTCEEGYATRCPFKGTVQCPSSQAEMRAATSSLVVTNYDKWTSARKFGQGMSHFKQVVFDEGHETHAAVARTMQVVLNYREISGLGMEFPSPSQAEEFVNWKPWSAEARTKAEEALLAAKYRLEQVGPKPASWVKHYTHMRHLCKRLATIATASPENWVVDEVADGYQFDPIRPGQYAESTLLLHVPNVVIVSATLRPKALHMIGVGATNFDFKEFPSDFDPARCPFYYVPTMRVGVRTKDWSPLWVRLDQIAAKRQDRKGIVHTISYANRNTILDRSRFAGMMMVNEKGEATTEVVEDFKQSPPGTILVSPSVGAGYDFPLRDCEWQFICKIPFPDGRSKITQARQEDDKEYGPYQAITKLVQIAGRPMRMKRDQCENFIGDDHLTWFLPRYGHLAPRSFHQTFRQETVLPQPPPKL